MNQGSQKEQAFTLIELLVVVATVTLLVTTLLPVHAATRSQVERIQCVNNLKRVGLAFRMWADAHYDRYPIKVADSGGGAAASVPASGATAPRVWSIFQVLSNELNTPKVVVCPADDRSARTNFLNLNSGTTKADFFNNDAISYFIGVDADETQPQMFLSGDRNIGTAPTHANSAYGFSPTTTIGWAGALGTNSLVLQWTDKMHQAKGNVLLADGSVQQLSSSMLRELLRRTGDRSGKKYSGFAGSQSGNNVLLP